MFDTRKEIQAKLDAKEAEITRLETELSAALAHVDESAESTQLLLSTKEDLAAAQELLEAEEATTAQLRADLEAEQAKTTPDAINRLVTLQLATAGHPPIEENHKDEPQTLKEQYAKLPPGAERKAFRDKHL